jgi:2'-5' RNA ligase
MADDMQFTGALIVALPEDGDPLTTLRPGQDADPHITMCWFGDANVIDPARQAALREAVEAAASVVEPFDVKVNGRATLGDDEAKVIMVESHELAALRDLLTVTNPIALAMGQTEQHPNFIPHITWSYEDEPGDDELPETVKIGKLGLWFAGDHEEYPFGGLSVDTLTAAADEGPALTPDTTDVKPLYLALTDEVDKDAVLDVLALVPASATNSTPIVYSRNGDGWVLDEEMRRAMLSTRPPSIVQLDDETAKNVIEQVDTYFKRQTKEEDLDPLREPESAQVSDLFGDLRVYSTYGDLYPVPTEEALYAAGGLDRNRGNAERLRRYWTVGPGGAKIRWGTGGDWYRCVKHLSKYLGPRAKGYCQLRHKEMTGVYTSTHARMVRQGRRSRLRASGADLESINKAVQRAFVAAGSALPDIEVTDVAPLDAPEHGARFRIPLVVPEGVETGDGRKFAPLALTTRELPLPLLWQLKTAEGHDGSVVVGRIDTIDRIDNGLGNATGVFDVGPYGREVERLVRGKFLRGISADLDKFEATTDDENLTEDGEPDPNRIGGSKMLINKARVSAITVVARPAFEECTITLIEDVPDGD